MAEKKKTSRGNCGGSRMTLSYGKTKCTWKRDAKEHIGRHRVLIRPEQQQLFCSM